jgi:hypothetical protein
LKRKHNVKDGYHSSQAVGAAGVPTTGARIMA